jgi:hypothetical protein
LSYSLSFLSILDLQIIQNATLDEAWESCSELTKITSEKESDLEVWEPAGSGFMDTIGGQVALLCVHVHHLAAGGEKEVLADIDILYDVSLSCETDYHKLKLPVAKTNSNGFILCLRWGALYGTEAYLGDLAVIRAQSDEKVTIFPGQWSTLAPDLNEYSHGFSTFILYRKNYNNFGMW